MLRECPFCAEEIQGAAVKCKHCGSDVSPVPSPPDVPGVSALPEMGQGPPAAPSTAATTPVPTAGAGGAVDARAGALGWVRRHPKAILLIAIILVVGFIGAVSSGGSSPTAAVTAPPPVVPSPSPEAGHALTGIVVANSCAGIANAEVLVQDATDSVIATGTTGAPEGPADSATGQGYACSAAFTVADVPERSNYSIVIDGVTSSLDDPQHQPDDPAFWTDWIMSIGQPDSKNKSKPSSGGEGGNGFRSRVTYKVTGPSGGDMTYQNSGDDSSQTSANLPWVKRQNMDYGDFYYVSAQNTGSGTIHCIVYIDGKKVEDNKANGLYNICTASGNV